MYVCTHAHTYTEFSAEMQSGYSRVCPSYELMCIHTSTHVTHAHTCAGFSAHNAVEGLSCLSQARVYTHIHGYTQLYICMHTRT
jgi:hypothetical protein